jgi:hypothetical protein
MTRLLSLLLLLCVAAPLWSQESFLTVKRRIRVTDGIARGATRLEAKEAAVANARRKAIERVATSFIHSYERTDNMVLTEEQIIQDIRAQVLRTKVRKVEYPYENVALVTVDFTIEYFDLDFFAAELRKSAESAMVRSLVISGWGQLYNRNYLHAIVFFSTTYGSLGRAYWSDLRTTALKREYLASADPVRSRSLYGRYRDSSWESAAWLTVGITSWAYSIWEAFEDRENTARSLDEAHDQFFPDFYYTREKSFVQKAMDKAGPKW